MRALVLKHALLGALGVSGRLSAQQRADISTSVAHTIPSIGATGVTTVFGLPLSEWVAVATLVFIALQAGHLIWKWRRAARRAAPRPAPPDTEAGEP